MISAKGSHRNEGFSYALDNGAWWAFQNKKEFDNGAFEKLVEKFGSNADFVVIPDIVCGGIHSLKFSESWLPKLVGMKLLLAVQDEMQPSDVRPFLQDGIGIFVGGSTGFKESTLPIWAMLRDETGCYLHIGRLNSQRKLRLAKSYQVNSFDGSGPSRFSEHCRVLNAELDQYQLQFSCQSSPREEVIAQVQPLNAEGHLYRTTRRF